MATQATLAALAAMAKSLKEMENTLKELLKRTPARGDASHSGSR
jgi:hypothetical protein